MDGDKYVCVLLWKDLHWNRCGEEYTVIADPIPDSSRLVSGADRSADGPCRQKSGSDFETSVSH